MKEQVLADVHVFLNADELAEKATYNGSEITAIVELGDNMGRGNTIASDSKGQAARAEIWVAVSDVPDPRPGDKIVQLATSWVDTTARSETYIVGDSEDVVGDEEDSGALLVQLLFASGREWHVVRVIESDAAMHRLECLGEESPW